MHAVGIPSYSIFGWQRPCYLMSDGYAATYKELLETTDWSKYGRGNDPRCDNCMAHCGYEPTAVLASTSSLRQSLRAFAFALQRTASQPSPRFVTAFAFRPLDQLGDALQRFEMRRLVLGNAREDLGLGPLESIGDERHQHLRRNRSGTARPALHSVATLVSSARQPAIASRQVAASSGSERPTAQSSQRMRT